MCGGTQVSNAAAASAPYMAQANSLQNENNLQNLFQYGVPETYTPNLMGIQNEMATQTGYADLMNKAYEQANNPVMYQMRQDLPQKVADAYDLNKSLTDQFLKSGLISAADTMGPAAKFGGGTMGNQTVMRTYGPAYQLALQNAARGENDFLASNPRKSVALDPNTAVSLTEGAKAGNIEAANQRKASLIGGSAATGQNIQNYNTGLMQGIIGESGQQANVINAARQNQMSNILGGVNLVAGIGRAFAPYAL